ncbi:hypothetical protein CRG98_002036 [Punica granatum]|uniref:Uncharacterized protein n=1 Tax=Punica granatum TaxID=22663 RepID=A0A2I0LA69_PUNGR|nr:hypothetical protein CRG98_002036 [Punica granatum]
MISGDSFSRVSVTRPHGKVDTLKLRDPKARNAGTDESPHSGCGHSHYAIQLVVTPARGSLELFELLLRLFGSSSTFVAPTTLLGLGSIAFLS